MNISILTFVRQNSFGANLQCYALCRILNKLGHNVELVDYRLQKKERNLMGQVGDYLSSRQFSGFAEKNLPKYTRYFSSYEEIKNNPPEADCYIVGSDQVWNPEITGDDALIYFLNYVPEGKLRISYAASFGLDDLNYIGYTEAIYSELKKFSGIGVREKTGLKILSNYFGLQGQVVLDPTLLIDDYSDIIDLRADGVDEMISFRLFGDNEYYKYLLNFASYMNLKPVLLNDRRFKNGYIYRPFVSVTKWLESILKAKFIITDSFHCLVFCILFKKNFLVVTGNLSRASRLTDLLESLGLINRYFVDLSQVDLKAIEEIDYEEVFRRLSVYRGESMKFLENFLIK